MRGLSLDSQDWARTPDGKVILRLIEEWEAGATQDGDIALCLTSRLGNDPGLLSGERHRAQFICTRDDARAIAHMILRTLAFSQMEQTSGFAAFQHRIQAPALRALIEDWNKARRNRRMPSWGDFKPAADAPYLGGIWAFNHDRASGEFIGRLAGKNIMLGFGKSLLGTPLRALHPPHVYDQAHASFIGVISQPACLRFSGGLFKIGDKIVKGERLILPMGVDPEQPDGVLGASWYEGYPLQRTPDKAELLHERADWCAL